MIGEIVDFASSKFKVSTIKYLMCIKKNNDSSKK